jgi:chromosome partitioning protein
LVVSQKGGVGKTTTSINLAAATALAGTRVLLLDADPLGSVSTMLNLSQHPARTTLRAADVELPGVLVTDVIPGLDVLSPYEEGSCSDEEFDELLRVAAAPQLQECYGCLIVGAPPFLGANPTQLLATSDELLLVMRAEPMAHRTLPAFLELVQRSRPGANELPLAGILLTLPDGENPGARWERELRGRFGARVLPQVIPFDEQVSKAHERGQALTRANPDSPAAQQYCLVAQSLGLAAEPRIIPTTRVRSALLEAASVVRAMPLGGRRRAVATPVLAGASATALPVQVCPPDTETIPEDPASLPPKVVEGPPPRDRRRRSSALRSALPPKSPSGAHSRRGSAPVAPPDRSAGPLAVHSPTPTGDAKTRPIGGTPLWPLWVVVAAFTGAGLRFVPTPKNVLPILVGLAVTLATIALFWLCLGVQEKSRRGSPPAPRPATKLPTHGRPKSDVAARLGAMTRRPNRASRRGG